MIQRLSILVILAAGLSLAQQTGITGRLTDPSNASVASAVVTATGDDGSKVQTLTNAQGIYQFPALRASKYLVRFQASGFAPAERTLSLLVGQVADVDVTLQLATASASVAVEAAVVAVDDPPAVRGQIILIDRRDLRWRRLVNHNRFSHHLRRRGEWRGGWCWRRRRGRRGWRGWGRRWRRRWSRANHSGA